MGVEQLPEKSNRSEILASRVISDSETIKPVGYASEHGYPIFEDQTGRKLYLVLQEPAQQFLTSMLLTDVVNRCQILFDRRTGHFYSQAVEEETPLEGADKNEMLADQLILANLFNIRDRDFRVLKNKSPSGLKVYHYDIAANFFPKYSEENEQQVREEYKGLTDDARRMVGDKVDRLKEYYSGPAGRRFVREIVNRAERASEIARERQNENAYSKAPIEPAPDSRYATNIRYKIGTNFNVELGTWEGEDAFYESFTKRLDFLASLRE
jgi:hypothetical protein